REQRLEVLHVEGTTVLRGIAAVFRETDLNLIANEHGRFARCVVARQQSEAEDSFIKRQGCRKVRHGEIHVVALITERFLERSLHDSFLSSASSTIRRCGRLP